MSRETASQQYREVLDFRKHKAIASSICQPAHRMVMIQLSGDDSDEEPFILPIIAIESRVYENGSVVCGVVVADSDELHSCLTDGPPLLQDYELVTCTWPESEDEARFAPIISRLRGQE